MTEEREHLRKLIELHRANLQHYEELEAKYGLDCPVYVKNAKEEARKGLAEARAKLAALEGGAPSAEPSIPAIPQNLPPRGEFIGREREMEQVRQALASRSYLVVIEGIGGIGKTVLALEVAHELWEKGLYEAVVWTTARDRALDLNDILDTFARTIDYPYIAQLPPEEKPAEAAKLMRTKTCLLLVDNYETIKDEAVPGFLLNLPEPSKALITTRHHALGEARTIPLKGMEQGEALALMRAEGQRLGLESVQRAGDEILLRLYQATGGAPLAIKWAVGQIKQKGQSLDSVLDSLYGARGDLFEFMFSRSWEMLSEDARCILMVTPIFATSASKEAIEAASDVHTWDLDEGLGQLVEMSLVEVSGGLEEQQRYSVHPLVRAFATAKLQEEKRFEERARLHAMEFFIAFARRNGGYGNWEGYNKLEPEKENVLSIMNWCYISGNWQMVAQFRNSMSDFLRSRGYLHKCIQCGLQTLEAAKTVEDISLACWVQTVDLGLIYYRQGNYIEVEPRATEALRGFRDINEQRGIAAALLLLGGLRREKKDFEQAEQLYLTAVQMAENLNQETDTIVGLGSTTSLIAWIRTALAALASDRGDYERAERELKRVRDMDGIEDDLERLAAVNGFLGNIARRQGRMTEARSILARNLALNERIGRLHGAAHDSRGLALIEESLGNFAKALTLARRANQAYHKLGMKHFAEMTREMVTRLEQTMVKCDSTADREN
jgi:tetratricopeptide (TPR) repeat protein